MKGRLDSCDYDSLAKLLHSADTNAVLTALGHHEAIRILASPERGTRVRGEMSLLIGERAIEAGFAAIVGPLGIFPLSSTEDLERVERIRRRIREWSPFVALASLSRRYVSTIIPDPPEFDEPARNDDYEPVHAGDERLSRQGGLTVVWPFPDEEIKVRLND